MDRQFTWHGLQPGRSSATDVVSVLGVADRRIENATFAQLDHLAELSWYEVVVTAYMNSSDILLLLVIASLSGKSELPVNLGAWKVRFGKPQLRLPSTVGKNAFEEVFPRHGLAIVVLGEDVKQVRLFPPCDSATYQERLYREPPAFRK